MKTLLYISLLFFSVSSFAQIDFAIADGGSGIYYKQQPFGAEYSTKDFEENLLQQPLDGKVYFTKNSKGSVFNEGNYNVEKQLLSVFIKDKELSFDPNTIYGFEFSIEGNPVYRFVSLPKSGIQLFYEILVEHSNVSLLLQSKVVEKKDEINPSLGITEDDKLVLKHYVYLFMNNNLILVKSKKSLVKQLNHKDLVEEYLNNNKFKLKDLDATIKFIEYYNSINL